MTRRVHSGVFFARQARLRWKMANMRAAKARKRLENPTENEPKMERWFRFEFGVRDKLNGETAWHDLVSVRHAARALGLVLKFI